MKNLIWILSLLILVAFSCKNIDEQKSKDSSSNQNAIDTIDATNNFYDNVETYALPTTDLEILGELINPGKVDFSKLKKHSIIVKEALMDTNGINKFVGAYRYDGYSLYDILNSCKLNKANKEEFNPIIDLYVEIENAQGEKVRLSWGEIYYPNTPDRILIATDVARIVPSKTKDLWPLPTTSKLVVGNDLLTERNISNPSKITIKSYSGNFKVEKGMSPMYLDKFKIFVSDSVSKEIDKVPNTNNVTYNSVFYGRGRGIHSTTPFNGMMVKDFLSSFYKVEKNDIQSGYFVFVGLDGYRCVVTLSELFNRNDQQVFLFVTDANNKDGGKFKIFPACDFFSDRAVKSLSEIHYIKY